MESITIGAERDEIEQRDLPLDSLRLSLSHVGFRVSESVIGVSDSRITLWLTAFIW